MPSDRIKFDCPKCLATVRVSTEQAGQRIACPDCQASLKVPDLIIGNQALGDLFISESTTETPPVSEEPQTEERTVNRDQSGQPGDDLFSDLDVDSLKFQDEPDQKPVRTPPVDKDLVNQGRPRRKVPKQQRSEQPVENNARDDAIVFINGDEALPTAELSDQGDPFDYDDTAALRIEGLTEDIASDEVYGVKCPVCDTRIHVHEDQVGQQVECPICYSRVRVPGPPKKPETKAPWKAPAQAPTENEEPKNPKRVEPPASDEKIDESYGLAPVERDLLAPRIDPDDLGMAPEPETEPVDDLQVLPDDDKPASAFRKPGGRRRRESVPQTTDESIVKEAPRQSFDVPLEHEITTFAVLKEWMQRIGLNMDLIMRAAIAVMFLTLAYMMLDAVSAVISNPNTEFADKFVGAAMPGIGAMLCLGIATLTLSITLAIVLRDSAAGDFNMNQWPGFGFSEWFGSFAFVAFSLWVASLPGLVIGNIGWAMTDRVDVMLIMTSISMFLLGPVCLICALYNDSVMNVFSPEILKSLSHDSASWIATYKFVGITLGVFLLGTLILYLPFFLFSFVGALIHSMAILAFALIVGLQAGKVIGDIQRSA